MRTSQLYKDQSQQIDQLATELQKLQGPAVIMLVGLPGMGKTHLTRELKKRIPSLMICSADGERAKLGNVNDQSLNRRAWTRVHTFVRRELKRRHVVLIDATYARQADRQKDILLYKTRYRAKTVVAVHVTGNLDDALRRNRNRHRTVPRHVLRRMSCDLHNQPPMVDEREFDQIFKYRN